MDLARGVVETQEAPREDGNEVLHVVDVRHRDWQRVDVVREDLVCNARLAVPNETYRLGRQLQVQEDGVDEADRSACCVPLRLASAFNGCACAAACACVRGAYPTSVP